MIQMQVCVEQMLHGKFIGEDKCFESLLFFFVITPGSMTTAS